MGARGGSSSPRNGICFGCLLEKSVASFQGGLMDAVELKRARSSDGRWARIDEAGKVVKCEIMKCH